MNTSTRWKRDNVCAFVAVHAVATLAILPALFTYTGAALLLVGCFLYGACGISVGYHRLLTHRSFSCPRWVEYGLVLLAVCALQDSPPHWVAVHRRHHQFADDDPDPHSPLVSFFWAHMGWLLVKQDDMRRGPLLDRYAKDILRDPLYAWMDRRSNWIKVAGLSWLGYFAAGAAAAVVSAGSVADAVQFGFSLLIWGAVLRTVIVWHMTWTVNSVTHLWGYRSDDTPDDSRNNPIIGFLVSGEGWHNNHHADPAAARYGQKWWELDAAWLVIRGLMICGLARDVVPCRAMRIRPRSARM